MARRGLRSNRQLIAAILIVIVAGIGWIFVRQHEAKSALTGDPSNCWTATCRDAVLQSNHDRTTNAYARPPAERE